MRLARVGTVVFALSLIVSACTGEDPKSSSSGGSSSSSGGSSSSSGGSSSGGGADSGVDAGTLDCNVAFPAPQTSDQPCTLVRVLPSDPPPAAIVPGRYVLTKVIRTTACGTGATRGVLTIAPAGPGKLLFREHRETTGGASRSEFAWIVNTSGSLVETRVCGNAPDDPKLPGATFQFTATPTELEFLAGSDFRMHYSMVP